MQKELLRLYESIDHIESDNIYQAIADIKRHMQEIVEWLDKALPEEVQLDRNRRESEATCGDGNAAEGEVSLRSMGLCY